MDFTEPIASKDNLARLLEYLNDTPSYQGIYEGNRATDFMKCFDLESEWCAVLAGIVVRGWEDRGVEFSNIHHIVPACFYGKRTKEVDCHNTTKITYQEHVVAHFCMAMCARSPYKGKLKTAFKFMYGMTRKKFPSYEEVLAYISDDDVIKLRESSKTTVLLRQEGRTPYFEDPAQALKDYYALPRVRERKREQLRKWRVKNREHVNAGNRQRYHENIDAEHERSKKKYECNKDRILEKGRTRYRNNIESERARSRKRYNDNKETERERSRLKHEKYKEKDNARNRARYWKNRESESLRKHLAYERKTAAGYRLRKDQVTGKSVWVFVGATN